MNKLSSPFRDGTIRITQRSHNHLGGRTDFTMVRAVDCNREPYSANVYAEGDGVVIASINLKNPDSYLHIHYDGLPGNLIRELVHVRPSVAKGAKVKRGQLIGTLEPYRVNWYGTGKSHFIHLHWSFLNTNKTGAPNAFNYLDRKVNVTTNAAVIKNDRVWFNANGTFNWTSFGDYKLDIKPPTITDPCAVEKNQIGVLQAQIKALNVKVENLDKENLNLKVGKASAESTILGLDREIANFRNLEITYIEDIKEVKNKNKDLAKEVLTLQDMINDQTEEIDLWIKQLAEANTTLEGQGDYIIELENRVKNLKAEMQKKDVQILELKDKVKGGMSDLEIRDLLRELVVKVGEWLGVGNK